MIRVYRSNRNPVFENWWTNDLRFALGPLVTLQCSCVAFPVGLCGIIRTPADHSNLARNPLWHISGDALPANPRWQATPFPRLIQGTNLHLHAS